MPGEKAELRGQMKSVLAALPADEISRRSPLVCDRLEAWIAGLTLPPDRKTVLLFAPIPNAGEVDLWPFADRWMSAGGDVGLPRIEWTSRTMTPVPIRERANDVIADARGIPLPRAELPTIDVRQIGVIVVPGLAFDARGGRLGRGMGFYDRFLESLPASPRVHTVAAVFDEQLVERVPMEPHDQRVSAIVTDRRVIDVQRS